MKTIRNNVFETNSSSTHVLTLSLDDTILMSENEFTKFKNYELFFKDGKLINDANGISYCGLDDHSWDNLGEDLYDDELYANQYIVKRLNFDNQKVYLLTNINGCISKTYR